MIFSGGPYLLLSRFLCYLFRRGSPLPGHGGVGARRTNRWWVLSLVGELGRSPQLRPHPAISLPRCDKSRRPHHRKPAATRPVQPPPPPAVHKRPTWSDQTPDRS